MGRFLGGKGRPSSCFVTLGRGMLEVTVKKLCKSAIVYTFYTSNSRCGKCWQVLVTKPPKFHVRGELYSLKVLSI